MSTAEPSRSRRPNRDGTLYEIKTGRDAGKWRAEIRLADGTRRTFFGSEQQVKDKLADAQHAVRHNVPVEPPRTKTVSSYLDDWLEAQREHLRPRTWTTYAVYVKKHIVPSIGRVKLAELDADDIDRLHRECRTRGKLGARSVRQVHSILSKALKQAEARGQVVRNVAKLAPAPKSERPKVHPFTPAEALAFLEAVKHEPEEPLYVTTLGLGLRRGEVLGLRWNDIDWTNRRISVGGQVQRETGVGLVYVQPKTADSVAVIDCPNFVLDALLAHRDRQMFTGRTVGYVFTGATAGPLDPDAVSHHFVTFLERHGLRRTRFHDLRHSTASLLLARGVPLWQVSKILRHAGVQITADTYGHLYAETSRQVADTMNDILGQARRPS